jgi:urea transport system substrate-binding protein
MSVDTPENDAFIDTWTAFIGDENRVTNDPMEAHYIGFNMWVKAVEAAGTTDADAVIDSIVGIEVPNLTGGISTMLPNHHITKPVLVGEIQADGQFDVVWETDGLVPGDAWSDHLPESAPLIADWTPPINCGNYNTVTETCGGGS